VVFRLLEALKKQEDKIMKIVCSKDNLIEGINIVQKAVSTKTSMPILEGILIEAGDVLKLTGNDLEIAIECIVDAEISEKGAIVLNARMFGDIIRRLPDSDVFIETQDNDMVTIECENSHFEIKGIKAEGYPSIPEIEKEHCFTTTQKLIREMIRQTIFAVATDDFRPVLTGTYIEVKGKEINFVAIDGYRGALRKSTTDQDIADFSVIVPAKTLNEVVKILQPVDEELTISSSKNQIMFDAGKFRVFSRLIEGEYLNYRVIFPKEYETKITVNTKSMLSSIERAYLITQEEKDRIFPIKFDIKNDKLIISSNTPSGSVREEILVQMEGNNLEIGFNPRYFIDALKVIDDESIEVLFTSNLLPCSIKPIDSDAFSYMILPFRI